MCMISRVNIKNKGKQGKRKNSVKNKDQTEKKKKRYKETLKSVEGVEPRLSARASNSLTTAPQWHIWFEKLLLLYQNHFLVCQRLKDAVWSWRSCIYHEFKYICEEN